MGLEPTASELEVRRAAIAPRELDEGYKKELRMKIQLSLMIVIFLPKKPLCHCQVFFTIDKDSNLPGNKRIALMKPKYKVHREQLTEKYLFQNTRQ